MLHKYSQKHECAINKIQQSKPGKKFPVTMTFSYRRRSTSRYWFVIGGALSLGKVKSRMKLSSAEAKHWAMTLTYGHTSLKQLQELKFCEIGREDLWTWFVIIKQHCHYFQSSLHKQTKTYRGWLSFCQWKDGLGRDDYTFCKLQWIISKNLHQASLRSSSSLYLQQAWSM